MYSHKAASKTAIERLERSIEVMGTMPEQIAEAHVRFMGYDLPVNCSAAVKRGRLLKLLSDEVLREAKRAEREEFMTKAKQTTGFDAGIDDDDNDRAKIASSSPPRRNNSSSSISSNRRICDDGDNNSTETKIVNGGGRYKGNNDNNNNNNNDSDSDSDSSVQGTERAAPPPRSPSPPGQRGDEHRVNAANTNTYADSESEESEEDPDNYYGKAALEPEAPLGSNPFATITSEKQKEMEKEALRQIEEAKKMMADLKFNDNSNDNSDINSSDDDHNDDNDSNNNISNNDNNTNEEENITSGGLTGESFAQHQNSKFKNVSFPPLPIEDDVRSIRSDAVSSRGGDDVGSVKDFGGSEYGGSIYSVAATMGSNQNEQEDDEKLLDQLVEEAESERERRILRGRIDEEDSNIIDDDSEGKENEVPL
jgi:hypothetical protein